jgi:hypothetical protein
MFLDIANKRHSKQERRKKETKKEISAVCKMKPRIRGGRREIT